MSVAPDTLDAMLKRLNLANARRIWPQLVVRAEEESWSYSRFLEVLIGEEVAHRQGTRLQRCTAQAKFPFLKTIDDFDFSLQSQLRLALLGSYLGADFVADGRNLILYGRSGRGKTHLAVAIAYRAIQNGFDALITTAAALIDDLSMASRQGRFQEVLHRYTRVHVLVIDEVGYLSCGDDAANVLYHVVNQWHLARRPMILTTNKPPKAWGAVLHDPDLAEAIVDRILERGRFIAVDGPSYRTRHIDPSILTQPATFSGIGRPEFPEPTEAIHGPLTKQPFLVTDNGSSFIARAFGRYVRDDFAHVRIQYRTPTQLGLLERFHQTFKDEEVYWRLYEGPQHARECFAEFHRRYNQVRPHWALRPEEGGDPLVPADVYAHGRRIQVPSWQPWAREAKRRLDRLLVLSA